MKGNLRSDKFAGIATGLFGAAMAIFAVFGLVIVAFQRMVMSIDTKSKKHTPGFERFDEMMHAIQGLFTTYLPFMVAGGVIFAIVGYYVYRGSTVARRIGQLNAVAGLVWIVAYMTESFRLMKTMENTPLYQDPTVLWVSIIGNSLIFVAFPVAIIYILWPPKLSNL